MRQNCTGSWSACRNGRQSRSLGRDHPHALTDSGKIRVKSVRAWTDKFDDWPRIRSDLAVAIYGAAHEAGMSFPFPQREVRVLNDPATTPTLPPVDGATKDVVDETQK